MKNKKTICLLVTLVFALNSLTLFVAQATALSSKTNTVKKIPAKTLIKPAPKPPVKTQPKPPIKPAPTLPVKVSEPAAEEILKNVKSYINEDNIMKIIEELSSAKYGGRATGTKGNELATQYISNYFKNIGLEGINSLVNFKTYTGTDNTVNFKQYYQQYAGILNKKPVLELIDKNGKKIKDYKYRFDFAPSLSQNYNLKSDITSELYIVEKIEDINPDNPDTKGKILLIPISIKANITSYKIMESVRKGVNVIVESEYTYSSEYFITSVYHNFQYMGENSGLCFKASIKAFKELCEAAKSGTKSHLSCNYDIRKVTAANVIGMIPGSDPEFKNDFIVLSSHFDHVGYNFDGTYNSGAFDNASGTATIMEIARVMKEKKLIPKKTIIFAAFNGEETGLAGSKEFLKSFPMDFYNAIDINFDGVGFKGNDPYSIYMGSTDPNTDSLANNISESFSKVSIEASKNGLLGGGLGSDHMSFSEKGIPSLLIMDWASWSTFHSPNDVPKTLDKYEIEKIIEAALNYIFLEDFNTSNNSNSNINLQDFNKYIDEGNIIKITQTLSSSDYENRMVRTKGNKITEEYIVNQFKNIGLEYPEKLKDFRQTYPQYLGSLYETPIFELINKDGQKIKSFTYKKDFLPLQYETLKLKYDVTTELNVIEKPEDLTGDIANLLGKTLLISQNLNNQIQPDIIDRLLQSGVNIISELPYSQMAEYPDIYFFNNIPSNFEKSGFAQFVSTSVYNDLVENSKLGGKCHISSKLAIEEKKLANIIGMIPGSDPELKDQYIVLTCNLDGMRKNTDGSLSPYTYDNGSGIAALLEISRVIKENNIKPKKTIVFTALNSSKELMVGVEIFTRNPIIDLSKATIISLDMIGLRNSQPYTLTANNAGNPNTLFDDFSKLFKSSKIYSKPGEYDSMVKYTFETANIPSILISDIQDARNLISQSIPEEIDYVEMKQVINIILSYILSFDNNL